MTFIADAALCGAGHCTRCGDYPFRSSAACQFQTRSRPPEPKLTSRSDSSVLPSKGSLALMLCQLTAVTGSLQNRVHIHQKFSGIYCQVQWSLRSVVTRHTAVLSTQPRSSANISDDRPKMLQDLAATLEVPWNTGVGGGGSCCV